MRLLLAPVLLLPAAAGAQTMFAWPTRDIDYARYTMPEQCLALADRLVASAWRGAARAIRDTLPYNPKDTLPTGVVTVVRACEAKFRTDSAAPFELPWLLHLDLLAGRDDLAERVVARELGLARTPVARATVLATTVGELLGARPARIADAVAYAARVDQIVDTADEVRRDVHRRIALYALSVLDTTLLATQLAAYHVNSKATGPVDLMLSASLRMLRQPAPDERAALRDVMLEVAKEADPTLPPAAVDQQLDAVIPRGRPHVAASFWFTPSRDDTIRPAPGRISLLVFVGARCGADADACAPEYAVLRRLHQRFGDALDITLMARTEGYFRSYPPPTPTEESELLRQYFLEDVGLPGALGVVTTSFTRLPDPDRRRRDRATPNLRYFGQTEADGRDNIAAERILLASVVGPDGLIKLVTTCEPEREQFLTAIISKLVSQRP